MSKRGKTVTRFIKEARRKQAEERKAEYDKLSTAEKLAKLPPTGAAKQRARLEKALAKPAPTKVESAPEPALNAPEAEVVPKKPAKKSKK